MNISEGTRAALERVAQERMRQDGKWGENDHPSGGLGFGAGARAACEELRAKCDAAMARGECTFRDILLEEVAELISAETPEEALAEATQVAAVLVKLVEYLEAHDDPGGAPAARLRGGAARAR